MCLVIDNYWQTESGWPIMAIARGLDDRPTRLGSPGVPMYGYNVQLLNEVTERTVWRQRERDAGGGRAAAAGVYSDHLGRRRTAL